MKYSRLFVVVIVISIFTSCDPGYSVILSNKSDRDIAVTAVYPDAFKKHLTDTLGTFDNRIKANRRKDSDYGSSVVFARDTNLNTYSFVLKANQGVVVEGAAFAAYPTWGQLFILDNKDSVVLSAKKNKFRRSWFIGGNWTYTIH